MAIQVVNDTQAAILAETQGESPQIQPNGSVSPPVLSLSQNPVLASYLNANPPVDWFSAGYLQAEYTFYAITTIYQTDLGIQAAPSTAPMATVQTGGSQGGVVTQAGGPDQNNIVRVRRPITTKTVTWTAQRINCKPILPHWNTGTTNEKLLYRTISARNPLQSINQKTWEVSGVYVYAFKVEPFITVNTVEYFVLPASKSAAENSALGSALHAYTQGDFSFAPINASWIPVTTPLDGTLPIGFGGRVGHPDSPISLQGTIQTGNS